MPFDRRIFLPCGLCRDTVAGALYAMATQAEGHGELEGEPQSAASAESPKKITPEVIQAAAALAGVTVTPEQQTMMLDGLNQHRT